MSFILLYCFNLTLTIFINIVECLLEIIVLSTILIGIKQMNYIKIIYYKIEGQHYQGRLRLLLSAGNSAVVPS